MAYSDLPGEGQLRIALFEAIAAGDVSAVAAVLDRQPAYVNAPNDDGYVPLRFAAKLGQLAVVKFLLARGADAAVGGRAFDAALMSSVVNGQAGVAMFLILQGVDVNKTYERGETLLYTAAWFGRAALVEMLLGMGAAPNLADEHGITPLLKAVENNASVAIDALLRGGAVCDVHSAAALGRLDDLAALLAADARRASAPVPDRSGWRPLHFAAVGGQREAMLLLVRHGALVDDPAKAGDTPLHRAAADGQIVSVSTLVSLGADANASDDNGRTPLHWAAANNQTATAECLIGIGADPAAASDDGTPADEAEEQGHNALAVILRRAETSARRLSGGA